METAGNVTSREHWNKGKIVGLASRALSGLAIVHLRLSRFVAVAGRGFGW